MLTRVDKRCSVCGETKPADQFHVVRPKRGGEFLQGRCKTCNGAYCRQWREDNLARHGEITRRSQLKRFGITPAEYDALLAKQNGVCAICGGDDPHGRRLAVDHDHETDEVRGLLCTHCNTALGLLKEDATLLLRALQYLTQALN